MRHRQSATLLELLALRGAIPIALGIFVLGAYVAYIRCDAHWVNRAGAAVVSLQAVAAGVEFFRRQRLQRIRSEATTSTRGRKFLENEIERAETHAFTVVLILAFVGELVHGFGDLLFVVVLNGIR